MSKKSDGKVNVIIQPVANGWILTTERIGSISAEQNKFVCNDMVYLQELIATIYEDVPNDRSST